jgi:hypothetical protein
MGAFLSALVGFFNAVPAFKSLVDEFINLWIQARINAINSDRITKQDEANVLYKQIAKAETNEERKSLSITLRRLQGP